MLRTNQSKKAIETYSDQNYLTEAICLTKAFGDKETLRLVLERAESKFGEAKDRQAQAQKMTAALK